MTKFYTWEEVKAHLDKPLPFHKKVKYAVKRWKRKPRDLYLNVKWFIQRGKRGYSDRDVWNFDYYLAKVISGGSTELADILHGYPGDMTPETWEAHLREVAYRFKDYMDDQDGLVYDDPEEYKKKIQEMFTLLASRFPHMWD